jgi:hypothetical protein
MYSYMIHMTTSAQHIYTTSALQQEGTTSSKRRQPIPNSRGSRAEHAPEKRSRAAAGEGAVAREEDQGRAVVTL